MIRILLAAAAAALAVAPALEAQQAHVLPPVPPAARAATIRNPRALSATELLGRNVTGTSPRIRFEWDQVGNASAYLLAGRWTDGQSWAVRSQEYRVTARNATSWEIPRVTFEVSLPRGDHSWQVTALFEPDDTGDFEHPARVSFDLR
jgi:hypothetical protein